MSFIDEHPEYESYNESNHLYYHSLPNNSIWSELESLIAEAGGLEGEFLAKIVQSIAIKVRYGNIDFEYAYQYIPDLVSHLRRKIKDDKFYLFMDCLAILCDEGDLLVDVLNEFLDENRIGYRAEKIAWTCKISWKKINTDTNDKTDNLKKCIQSDSFVSDSKNVQDNEANFNIENYGDNMSKNGIIFISHRTNDKDIADMITDFLVKIGVPYNKIFCSSLPGNDVERQIKKEVREKLKEASLILLILSKKYYESAFCLNEAGVAWYLDEVESIPFGLPDINPDDMLGFYDSENKLRRIDDNQDISYLYDQVKKIMNLQDQTTVILTREMNKLIKKYEEYINNNKIDNNDIEDTDFDFCDEDEQHEFNSNVKKIIMESGGSITNIKELAKKLNLSVKHTKIKLNEAISRGIIVKIYNGSETEYRIKT